jgi:putative peptidoglycan lipid II flippase
MMLVAEPLITLIYMGRDVTYQDIQRAHWATLWFCAGIWAFEGQLVLLRVFYAQRDVLTPMKIALLMVLFNLALNLTLVWWMQEGGLALATTLAAILQSALLLAILRKRLGKLGLASLAASLGKGLLASLLMVEVAYLASCLLPVLPPNAPSSARLLDALLRLPLILLTAAATYGLTARFLDMPELNDVPLLRRLRRLVPKRS